MDSADQLIGNQNFNFICDNALLTQFPKLQAVIISIQLLMST